MFKQLTRSRLARNAGWLFIAQMSGYAFRLIYFILVARLLGVVQYGIVVGAFSLVNLIGPYCSLGSGPVLMRYVSSERAVFAKFWGNILLTVALMSGIVTVLLRCIAPYILDAGGVSVVVTTAVAVCLCEQIVVSATQVAQAFQEMRLAALLNQLTNMFRMLAAAGMLVVIRHATATAWCTALLISSAAAAVTALTLVTVNFGRPTISHHLLLRYCSEGVEFAFGSSTASAYNDLDKTMLSHYGMDAANGVYSMAYRVIDIATSPVVSLQMATQPRLFQLGATQPSSAIQLGRRVLGRALLVSFGTALALTILAPLVPLVVGKGFHEAPSALRWLCLIPIFRTVHGLSGSVLTGLGRQRYRTITQAVAVLLNFGLNLILIPRYGWHGAAYASLATDGALAVMNWTALEFVRVRVAEMDLMWRV